MHRKDVEQSQDKYSGKKVPADVEVHAPPGKTGFILYTETREAPPDGRGRLRAEDLDREQLEHRLHGIEEAGVGIRPHMDPAGSHIERVPLRVPPVTPHLFKDDEIEPGNARVHAHGQWKACLLYTSPSPRDRQKSRMPSSA